MRIAGKQPYLLAHFDDFAALRRMVMNRRRDKIEIIAPMDARAVDIKKLRSLGAVGGPRASTRCCQFLREV
jgi:hypothetical protein